MGDPKMILVVDDNKDITDTVCMVLQTQGHQAKPVFNGSQCLDALGEEEFSIVFLDVMIPGMDGMQIAKKIREAHADPPKIIFLTVKQRAELDMTLADGYVQKPFGVEDILGVLD